MFRKLKWHTVSFLSLILFTVYSLLPGQVFQVSTNADTITYQVSSSFNNSPGVQGADGWYYQQWDGTSYSNLSWDSTNQRWYGSQTYLWVYSSSVHPESSYDPVRRWSVPSLGTARIYGNVKKADTGGGDGITVKILLNADTIWGPYDIAYNDNVGLNYDFTENVGPGDHLYFIVSKKSTISYDLTSWDPKIDFTESTATTTTYQASTSFSNGYGIQGKDQWYYMQWNGTTYSGLSWDNSNQRWYGSQTYLRITGTTMHPESNYDAVRKWIVPSDGYARLYGNVKKADTGGGDGVSAKIMVNSANVWGYSNIAYNDSTGLNYDFPVRVSAGDAIYFIVTKRDTINYDLTSWDPKIDFTPLASGTNVRKWEFTSGADGWTAVSNCSISASNGYLNTTITGSNPVISSPSGLNKSINKNCLIKVRLKNSTSSTNCAVYFTTSEDQSFNTAKAKSFQVNANDANYTEYAIDMSGIYGWNGILNQIRLQSAASTGSLSIDYVHLQTGGNDSPPFSLLDKEVVFDNNTLKNVLNLDYYPDTCLGIIRNSNASYKFFSSDGGAVQCTTITSGTLDNPAVSIDGHRVSISNTPTEFDYVATGPVYQDPEDANTILSFIHLERHYEAYGVEYFYSSLGIAITRNGGSTWTWCGEIIQPDVAYNESAAESYDIGAGTYIIQNENGTDYFYVYAIDHAAANPSWSSLSVSKASVESVLSAAKNNTVTSWYKYYNGSWTQPGMNGSFTNIGNPNVCMNFMSVGYNSYLDKFLLAYSYAINFDSNYVDISLLIADSPLDFYNDTVEYLIDTSPKWTQYPTIVGLGNDDPECSSQKNFYLYYTQWANNQYWSSDTNLIRKMIVLD